LICNITTAFFCASLVATLIEIARSFVVRRDRNQYSLSDDGNSVDFEASSALTVKERRQLHQAFLSAFPSREDLDQMLQFELGWNLNTLAGPANQSVTIAQVIRWAEAEGKLNSLVEAALKSRAGNPLLIEFNKSWQSRVTQS
jgi:hypothetical protein